MALCLVLAIPSPTARANVYATNVKLNGDYTNVVCAAGTGLTISYLLNEPATRGVTVNILYGNNPVRAITVPAGGPGALLGTNSVAWDGLDSNSNALPGGMYSVAVTAMATGFTNWTQTSVDTNPGNYVWSPEGIAVDQNRGSRYFGRVFVGNADVNTQGTNVGDSIGILKLNADGSPAEESPTNWLSTGGYDWSGGNASPWKLEISADDHVYVMDGGSTPQGLVFRWDAVISTNSQQAVLQPDNLGSGGTVSPNGLAMYTSGTNSQLWIADYRAWLGFGPSGSEGAIKYNLTDGICATNDTGVSVVGTHDNADGSATGTNLDQSAYDLVLDKNQNIYVIQNINDPPDISARVLRFPAYDPSTNGGAPETVATWFAGTNDDSYNNAYGIAVDSTVTYVAVAIGGPKNGNGVLRILSAADGSLVTDLDTDTNTPDTHEDTACAWDAAGNVYVSRYYDPPSPEGVVEGMWRVFSPPGQNQSTTVAPETVQVIGSPVQPPVVTKITQSNGLVAMTFTAGIGEPPSSFSVLGASVVTGPYSAISGVSISTVSPGVFQATFSSSMAQAYYRIEIPSGVVAPRITSLALSGDSVTVNFGAGQADASWYFTLQSAGALHGRFADVSSTSATQVGPGQFKFVAPANGPSQFYRIRR